MDYPKKGKLFYHLLFLFLPGLTIELFSGSTPPLYYFNPISILFFAVAYGMTLIILRELKVRWQLTWQFLFLIPITGIYIEAIFMQSFFNIAHEDLGILSNYGVLWNVQWPWAIYLVIMHGFFSVVVPLMIMDLLYPKFKTSTLLNRRSATLYGIAIVCLTIFQLFAINTKKIAMFANYSIDWPGTITWSLIIALLVYTAYKMKNITLSMAPIKKASFTNHFIGLIYMVLLLLGTYFFAYIHIIFVLLSQLILTMLLIRFVIKNIYQQPKSLIQLLPYLNGILIYFVILAVLQGHNLLENNDPTNGMQYVGYSFLVLTLILNIKTRFFQKPSDTAFSASS